MIKRVRITNFKSLADVSVELDPVTVLIGRSGSGKSNFVDALRWLRDYLILRDDNQALQNQGGVWDSAVSATATRPAVVSFAVEFRAPGITEEFGYEVKFLSDRAPSLVEEHLRLGDRTLYHHSQGQWIKAPFPAAPPQPNWLTLGALTGIREATIAHLVLTNGIGCYAFPDDVLTAPASAARVDHSGLSDGGDNFLQTFTGIDVNLQTWHALRDMVASLRRLKPDLKRLDLEQPQRQRIVATHETAGRHFVFDVSQESEGFRRLLACLIAIYQSPPKQTLIFDEPEKGIYPAGLAVLADEFKGYASKGRGQVLLTTHSPEFLKHFEADQIRVVEMRDFCTHIGPVSPEQLEALHDHVMKPSDLLTVDEARLAASEAGAH
jgi:predicted ATPase